MCKLFVFESLKTSNFASNLPALGKNKKNLEKNESSKSKFDIQSRSFNNRSFDIRIRRADARIMISNLERMM